MNGPYEKFEISEDDLVCRNKRNFFVNLIKPDQKLNWCNFYAESKQLTGNNGKNIMLGGN